MRKLLALIFSAAIVMPLGAQSNETQSFIEPLTDAAHPLTVRLLPAVGYFDGTYYDPYYLAYVSFSGIEGAVWLSAAYRLPFFPAAFVGVDIGAGSANGFVLGAKAGADYGWRLWKALEVSLFAQLGAWYPVSAGAVELIPAVGFDVSYRISPTLAAGFMASALLSTSGFTEIMSGVSLTYSLPFGGGAASGSTSAPPATAPSTEQKPLPTAPKPLEQNPAPAEPSSQPAALSTALSADQVAIESLFPVFYKYYDDHPLGSLRLKNTAAGAMSDLKLTFWVKQFMDGPKDAEGPNSLKPGDSATFKLYGIFTEKILDTNEATKAQAQIDFTYTLDGKPQKQTLMQTIRILDRNAMTWEDDRRAAAFISARDPGVMTFAKRVVGVIKGSANPAVNANLQIAVGIHEALSLYGITYVKDPKTTSIASGTKKEQPDFLQFPRQTMEFKAGDCDDLTILYASLFEAVGIDTALITTPGHIYMAFSPDMSAADARASFSHVDNLIIRGDKVWIPIEVTDRSDFMTAWQTGVREWRESLAKGQANLYETHEAWTVYEPAGLSGAGQPLPFPDEAKLASTFTGLFSRWVESEISTSVATLQAQIKQTKESSKSLNALGILYARYGLYDKATAQFTKVIQKEQYVPSLLNMGNIAYTKRDFEGALGYWEKAYAKQPKNPHVLLSLARASQDVENYFAVKKYYAELKKVDGALAEQFAYLDLKGEEASRAADISGAHSILLWDE